MRLDDAGHMEVELMSIERLIVVIILVVLLIVVLRAAGLL